MEMAGVTMTAIFLARQSDVNAQVTAYGRLGLCQQIQRNSDAPRKLFGLGGFLRCILLYGFSQACFEPITNASSLNTQAEK
jgi:hypothetical protein